MLLSYSAQIRERINIACEGTVFVASDFADIANIETVRRSLNRFVKVGIIRRIMRGVYEKPEYSELFQEYIEADPDAVAKGLARNYCWSIAPSGNTALNLLGLSTQVPYGYFYVSDGPYKIFRWGKRKIEFKHVTSKDITGLSYMTKLVVHALKALGRTHITSKVIDFLSSKLSLVDKRNCLREAVHCTAWVYNVICKICKGSML